jgi:predicted O-linked N-acetylglucosamine transferase (SPINDLY family)
MGSMDAGRCDPVCSTAERPAATPQESVLQQASSVLQNGMNHHRAGDLAAAEALYLEVLRILPDQPDALHLLGLIAHQAKYYARAVELFDKAIGINPNYAVYFSNRGNTLRELSLYGLALESFDQAILLKPDYAEAFFNRGALLHQMKQYQAALESYDRAISFQPDLADAHNNRGNTLKALQRYEEALASFATTACLNPNRADVHNNSGNVLFEMKQFQAALESYDKALKLDPNVAEAWCNRGLALLEIKQNQKALESFDKALLLQPGYMKRCLCDWSQSQDACKKLEEGVEKGEKVVTPFCLLAISDSPSLHKKAAEIYTQDTCSSVPRNTEAPRYPRRERIRIGYFSSDFRDHPVSYLMSQVFEQHDRDHFEILGFSTASPSNDEMGIRVSKAMDRFFDVHSMSDSETVLLSRKLEIDVAVDLNGLTFGDRTRIFAQRVAPIQVNYLGYPGTMGASFMDYLIADSTVVPEASQLHYSEKIIYMPNSFQANDSTRPISTRIYTRSEQGLPEEGFVFCCFSNNFKITPQTFDLWSRILARVKGSVLWLYASDPLVCGNLRRESEQRGVSPERLIFAQALSLAEHLRRQQLADLFLDTLPFNAGATASPALWAGLPVLTCMGETFAGRMAGSLLCAVGMPELVTTTESDYEELAVEIGSNPALAQSLKERLWNNRLTMPLFDGAAFGIKQDWPQSISAWPGISEFNRSSPIS